VHPARRSPSANNSLWRTGDPHRGPDGNGQPNHSPMAVAQRRRNFSEGCCFGFRGRRARRAGPNQTAGVLPIRFETRRPSRSSIPVLRLGFAIGREVGRMRAGRRSSPLAPIFSPDDRAIRHHARNSAKRYSAKYRFAIMGRAIRHSISSHHLFSRSARRGGGLRIVVKLRRTP